MRPVHRLLRAVPLAVVLLVVTAGPALADAPGPTHYRAEVTGIEPEVGGVDAAVLGGDSFLQLTVAPGHEAVVRGYDGQELYLRFDADGKVFVNDRSETYYQNQSRYASAEVDRPANLGADVPPNWIRVSTSGSYAWHDHRIHWMSPATLPFRADVDGTGEATQVDPDLAEPQLTTLWLDPIPVTVDGQQVGIVGEVTYLPPASPLPTVVAAIAALVLVVALGLRSHATGVVVGAVGAAVVALGVGLPQVVGLAAGVPAQPLLVAVPLIAMAVVVAGLSVRSRSPFALVVAGAGGLVMLGWAATNLGVLTAPILPPTTVPDLLVRVAVGLAAGGGLGAVAVGVRDLFAGDAFSLDREGAPEAG